MSDYILRKGKRAMQDALHPSHKEADQRDGLGIPKPDFSNWRKPDKTKEEQKKEQDEGYKKIGKTLEDARKHKDALKEWGDKVNEYWRNNPNGTRSGAKNFAGLKPSLKGAFFGAILEPLIDPDPLPAPILPPIGPPGAPNSPQEPPDVPTGPDQTPICGRGPLNPAFYNGGMGGGHVAQISIRKHTYTRNQGTKSKHIGICKHYLAPDISAGIFRQTFREDLDQSGVWYNWFKIAQRSGLDNHGYWLYTLDTRVRRYTIQYVGKKWAYKWLFWSVQRFFPTGTPNDPVGFTAHYGHKGAIDCIVPVPLGNERQPVDPNQYDRENDEDNMPCKWQRDEISYLLPELEIGNKKIGGSTIQIDDGLKPLAEYLCKAIELLHNGLGLNLLDDKEFPVNLTNQSGAKIKPKSMAETQHYYFEQVASLVGLPVKNTLTNLESETKDLQFKNIQDCLSYIVHQQRESDLDLMVLEQYSTRIAQQLEAVTQIALRQHSDIEMIVKEMGFKYITKTEKRPCLYKTGMKDDDEKTGIIELFKGGEVSYPVRIWKDDLDQRQIAMKTNLYAEIAARAFLQPTNTDGDVQGLDARVKMGKSKGEDWLEWVKTINTPETGVVSGSSTPFIEEYTKGTVAAKSIKAPKSGLSLFMKQPEAGKK